MKKGATCLSGLRACRRCTAWCVPGPSFTTCPPAAPAKQGWCFGVMGQRLATRVRILLLQSLLHQVRLGQALGLCGPQHSLPCQALPSSRACSMAWRPALMHCHCSRCLAFLLPQDIPFFDRHENSTAAMLSTLSADAAAVRGVVGDRLGHLATVAACVIGSYAIALKSRRAVHSAQSLDQAHNLRIQSSVRLKLAALP